MGDGAVIGDGAIVTVNKPEKQITVGEMGDGAIGDNANVTIHKQEGIDGGLVLDKAIGEAAARGRAEEKVDQLEKQFAEAIERIRQLEAEGNRPDAEQALQQLRESKDTEKLQGLLIEDRDRKRNDLVQRNYEISAVAYLRGDIEVAKTAVDEILKLRPNDLVALTRTGHIYRLHGELAEAEGAHRRVLELAKEQKDESWKAAALGNLGIVYKTRGELDKAEEMYEKSLEISEKLGVAEATANQYGNLGIVYEKRGDVEKAREYWVKSRDLFEKIGIPYMVEKVQGWIDGNSE